MAENSKIEWTHHTVNPWWGCTEVHAGCDNCYARVLSNRWGKDLWGTDKPRMETKNWMNDLKKYQKKAAEVGETHRVFIGSMMDIFEKPMPVVDWNGNQFSDLTYSTERIRDTLFSKISAGIFPNLLFLFLTKRPSNINKYIPLQWKALSPPENVMFGTSVVNQETADKLIPQLLEAPGKKFLSMEPLLGPVNLYQSIRLYMFKEFGSFHTTYFGDKIQWIIVGGESGHGRRPFDSDWARDLRSQCKEAVVPFFMKQIDKVIPVPEDLLIREFPVI